MVTHLCAVVEEAGKFIVTYPYEVMGEGTVLREGRSSLQLPKGRYANHPYFLVGGDNFLGFEELKERVIGEIARLKDKGKIGIRELYAYFEGREGYSVRDLFRD